MKIIMLIDSIKIILLAIGTNLFAEFLTWLLIYRTPLYKENKKAIKENIEHTMRISKKEIMSNIRPDIFKCLLVM